MKQAQAPHVSHRMCPTTFFAKHRQIVRCTAVAAVAAVAALAAGAAPAAPAVM